MGLNSYGQAVPSSETMLCFILEEDATTVLSIHVYHLIGLLLYPCLQITLLNQPVLYLPSYYFNQLYCFIKIKTIREEINSCKRKLAGASVQLQLLNLFNKETNYAKNINTFASACARNILPMSRHGHFLLFLLM